MNIELIEIAAMSTYVFVGIVLYWVIMKAAKMMLQGEK